METLNKSLSHSRLTLIDATELDDEQFNDLISNIDPRHSVVPILFVLAIFLTLALII